MQKTYRGGLCAFRPLYKGRGVPYKAKAPVYKSINQTQPNPKQPTTRQPSAYLPHHTLDKVMIIYD
jgi:hypothetical protein